MGLGPRIGSRCLCNTDKMGCDCETKKFPNPDPNNFRIEVIRPCGEFVALCVVYPDCTNYEGRKILVFKDSHEKFHGVHVGTLDPHFCDQGHSSPVARFEPTDRGWQMAIRFMEMMRLS